MFGNNLKAKIDELKLFLENNDLSKLESNHLLELLRALSLPGLLSICKNQTELNRLIDYIMDSNTLMDECITNEPDIFYIHSRLENPEQKARLFAAVIKEINRTPQQIIKGAGELAHLLYIFTSPEQESQFIDSVMSSSALFDMCFRVGNDIARIHSALKTPELRARLFLVAVKEINRRPSEVIKASDDLINLLFSFASPEQQLQLMDCVMGSSILFDVCFRKANDFAKVLSVLIDPNQKTRLFETMIRGTEPKVKSFILTSFDLIKILSPLSTTVHEAELTEYVLKDNQLLHACLKDVDDLIRMVNASVLFKKPLFERMVADNVLLKKMSENQFAIRITMRLYKDSPDMQSQLALTMLQVYSVEELEELAGKNGQLIVEQLSDQDCVLMAILNNEKLRNKLGVDYLRGMFTSPEQHNLIDAKYSVSRSTQGTGLEFFPSTSSGETTDEEESVAQVRYV